MITTGYYVDGVLIHIGPWDYQSTEVDGETVIGNPLPDDAVEMQIEVAERADGGLVAASDYSSMRRPEYPPLADQLDALWKGGDAAAEMRARVQAVKDKYPKVAQDD